MGGFFIVRVAFCARQTDFVKCKDIFLFWDTILQFKELVKIIYTLKSFTNIQANRINVAKCSIFNLDLVFNSFNSFTYCRLWVVLGSYF